MTIDDFNETVGTGLPQRRAAHARRARLRRARAVGPRPGDVAHVDGVEIRIEAVDGLRITRLRIALSPGL